MNMSAARTLIGAICLFISLSSLAASRTVDLYRDWWIYDYFTATDFGACGSAYEDKYVPAKTKSGPYAPDEGYFYHDVVSNDCDPDNDDYTEAWDFEYPSTGHVWGTQGGTNYTAFAIGPISGDPEEVWGRADVYNTTGPYYRQLYFNTSIKIYHSGSDGSRGILFKAHADALIWDSGAEDWVIDTAHPIDGDRISIGGNSFDRNGELIMTFGSGTFSVTPTISSAPDYYTFTMTAEVAHDYPLTRSVHPQITNAPAYSWINFFHDYDDCRLNTEWDDSGIDGFYYADGVPVPAEMFITAAANATFPYPFNTAGPPPTPDYFNIRNPTDRAALLNATFANLKIVNTMIVSGETNGGVAYIGTPATMVIIKSANESIYKHEFGHVRGIMHRGATNEVPFNPDEIDRDAAMFAGAITETVGTNAPVTRTYGQEFNRNERTKF